MQLLIGGYRLQLDLADDHRLDGRFLRRYAGFLDDGGAPDLRLAIEVDPSRRPAGVHPEYVDNPPLAAEGDLERVGVSGDGFEGTFDWNAGRARAVVPDSLAHVDLFVRIALGVGLLRGGATLLHAAAVIRDRFAIAFSGPSGAGKSTVARLCREAGLDVLADEMIVYRRSGVGARFDGTPFWDGSPDSGPCGALMFLVKAPRHGVRQILPDRALPRLAAAGGAPLALPAVQTAFFDACAAVLRRVPAYELEFTPDAGFWTVLDRLPEFAYFRPTGSPAERTAAAASATPVPFGGLAKRPRAD